MKNSKKGLYAYSVATSKEYGSVSLIFTDKLLAEPEESAKSNDVLFVDGTDFSSVTFGSFPYRLPNGVRCKKKKHKKEYNDIVEKFTTGKFYPGLGLGDKVADDSDMCKVIILRKKKKSKKKK